MTRRGRRPDTDFAQVRGPELAGLVIPRLNAVVDTLRNLKTAPFGARPYQVRLVWTQWSGGERGAGTEQVVDVVPILPTPAISDLTAVSTNLMPQGTQEVGEIVVSEISPDRYDEDVLNGLRPDGTPIAEDMDFFWEIQFTRASGDGPRRRFTPNSAPSLDATAFQWTVRLVRQADDRTRRGELR